MVLMRLSVHVLAYFVCVASTLPGCRARLAQGREQHIALQVQRQARHALTKFLLQMRRVVGWQILPRVGARCNHCCSDRPLIARTSNSARLPRRRIVCSSGRSTRSCCRASSLHNPSRHASLLMQRRNSTGDSEFMSDPIRFARRYSLAYLTFGLSLAVLQRELREREKSRPLLTAAEVESLLNTVDFTASLSTPLAFVGNYPCVVLPYPKMISPAGRPLAFLFAVDTGAQVNTINEDLARSLELTEVSPNSRYVQLRDFCFALQYLKSDFAALPVPVASPVGVGLLGQPFLNAFQGGVEFQWSSEIDGAPTVTLHGNKTGIEDGIRSSNLINRVPVRSLPGTRLPFVNIQVNGVPMPALLDTGSPITILNIPAASLAELETEREFTEADAAMEMPWWMRDSDFRSLLRPIRAPARAILSFLGRKPKYDSEAQMKRDRVAEEKAAAAARGDVLTIGGLQGSESELRRSTTAAKILVGDVAFPEAKVYVGNLATWFQANLGGMSMKYPFYGFGAVLGMDVLRSRPGMLYRQDEVFF